MVGYPYLLNWILNTKSNIMYIREIMNTQWKLIFFIGNLVTKFSIHFSKWILNTQIKHNIYSWNCKYGMETKIFFQWQPRHLNFLLICSCYLTPQISFCTGGSLSEVLESNRRTGTRMSESDFKQVLLHVAQGLKLIHSQNLVHLDIKPGQSLVNSLSSSILKNSRLL